VINIGCTLSHDVRLGAFATLSPGVHIAGNVVIGERATIGIGANIINGTPSRPLVIGPDSLVAAGATVIHDVAAGTVVGGVPARLLHRGVPE
jgi:acetyltransferase-like isoleucine patch superfamily enzyme